MDARQKYMEELRKYLAPLTADERADAIDFYDEYIEDAHFETYEQIAAELGTPRQLSRQILADCSIKANEADGGHGHLASTHSSWRVFWLVLAAIVTSPLTFALSLGALIILIVALALVFGIVVSLAGLVLGLFFTAGVMIYAGIGLLTSATMTGLFYLGTGLTALGILLVCVPLGYWIIRWLVQGIANLSKYLYQKLMQRRAK